MASLETSLYSNAGVDKGKISLPEDLFAFDGSRRTLHQAIVAYANNLRGGTSSTKTRGEVSGGGRKPWKQKGTGNARAGSIRSPLWRGGGIIFGPRPRSYRTGLTDQQKMLALLTALAEKTRDGAVSVFESFDVKNGKTAEVNQILNKAGVSKKSLLVVEKASDVLKRAMRNISHVCLVEAHELNAAQVMSTSRLLFTQPALAALDKRFPKS